MAARPLIPQSAWTINSTIDPKPNYRINSLAPSVGRDYRSFPSLHVSADSQVTFSLFYFLYHQKCRSHWRAPYSIKRRLPKRPSPRFGEASEGSPSVPRRSPQPRSAFFTLANDKARPTLVASCCSGVKESQEVAITHECISIVEPNTKPLYKVENIAGLT